jgi:toxin ParE1/3/4
MPSYRLSRRAEDDLRSIWRTIAADNPRAADRMFMRIIDRIELAAEHPLSGAPRPEIGSHARIVIEGPYIIIYEPHDEGLVVSAIVHGARDQGNWM